MSSNGEDRATAFGRSERPVPTYGDFVEAMRRKQVHGHDHGVLLDISRLERRRNWAIPSYDFGRLLDPTFSGNLIHRIPTGDTPVLPLRNDRAFVFTFGEERQLLIQRFGITTYPDDDGGYRFWFYSKAPNEPWLSMDGNRGRWETLAFQTTYLLTNPVFIPNDRHRCVLPTVRSNDLGTLSRR